MSFIALFVLNSYKSRETSDRKYIITRESKINIELIKIRTDNGFVMATMMLWINEVAPIYEIAS